MADKKDTRVHVEWAVKVLDENGEPTAVWPPVRVQAEFLPTVKDERIVDAALVRLRLVQ